MYEVEKECVCVFIKYYLAYTTCVNNTANPKGIAMYLRGGTHNSYTYLLQSRAVQEAGIGGATHPAYFSS